MRQSAQRGARAGRCPRRSPCWRSRKASCERVLGALPAAIVEPVGAVACALVPDPDAPGRRAELTGAVGAALRRRSARRCRGARRASASRAPARCWSWRRRGRSQARGLIDASEHVTALLLRSDPRLAQELVRDRLAPLASLRRRAARSAAGDARRVARGAGPPAGGRRAARRPSADGALSRQTAARLLRRGARRPRPPLRARPCAARGAHRRRRRVSRAPRQAGAPCVSGADGAGCSTTSTAISSFQT